MTFPNENYYDISISSSKPGPSPHPHPSQTQSQNHSSASSLYYLHSSSSLSILGNGSTSSLNQPSSTLPKKNYGPKRIGSLSQLSKMNEFNVPLAQPTMKRIGDSTSNLSIKRPGDYFVQKLASSPNVTRKDPLHRPVSGDSIASLHSNYSDEVSSVASSQFDNAVHSSAAANVLDSRLSSMTNNSIINSSPMESPSFNSYSFNKESYAKDPVIGDNQSFEEGDDSDLFKYNYSAPQNGSLSTITSRNNSEIMPTARPSPRNQSQTNQKSRSFSTSSVTSGSSPIRALSQSSMESASNLSHTPAPLKTNQRSYSTPQIYKSKSMTRVGPSQPPPPLVKSKTSVSPTLTRSKTRYLSSKETKERKQLRKKKYEENDDDDEILLNDLDNLIFNVPVIKNHSELYSLNSKSHSSVHTPSTMRSPSYSSGSTSASASMVNLHQNSSNKTLFSHSDLMTDNDNNKYNINAASGNKSPRGKLNSPPAKLTIQTDLKSASKYNITEDSIVEEDEASESYTEEEQEDRSQDHSHSQAFDSEITQNISQFYNERSTSFSKLVKSSREQNMKFKLPNFVKLQASMDELHLISPEKLSVLDQTRPVHLPPKTDLDKSKHNKEFQRVLTNYELNAKSFNDARKKSNQQSLQNHQQWLKLIISLLDESSPKQVNKKFTYEKTSIRKLGWESNVPPSLRYQFFMKILSSNNGSQDSINTINNSFNLFDQKYKNLSTSIKNNKDLEFKKTIQGVLKRPTFECILKELEQAVPTTGASGSNGPASFSVAKFEENFRYLLYVKSLSEYGLRKHDEIFLIPVLLILFQSTQSMQEIYCLLELINQEIFNPELLSEFNTLLGSWTNVRQTASTSMYLARYLSRFKDNITEFDHLNSNSFFDILTQINDKLPLSLSAPSTPVVAQQSFANLSQSTPLGLTSPNSSNLSVVSGTDFSNSPDTITPRTSSSTGSEDNLNDINSSSLQLMIKLLQMLIIYSNSVKTSKKNNLKILQTFLMVIFQYYHINWNDFQDLIKYNKSIKLNHSLDQVSNLNSFVDKWGDMFKKF